MPIGRIVLLPTKPGSLHGKTADKAVRVRAEIGISQTYNFRAWIGRAAVIAIVLSSGLANCISQGPLAQSKPSNSASRLKDLNLEELGNIEVTTYSKTPTDLWETPASVYVITSDDILHSGATSIADVLRLAPGVEVGRLSSTTWAVGIRGLQSNFSKSVLVLIDGRSVYTPLFAGVYWDVQDMPLDNIDHIEVIRGPGGTIWGPNAANGVINIITKDARDTQGVMASALGGSEDRTIDDLQFGARSRGMSYRVLGRGFERQHEYHSDGIDDDTWHQERVGFRGDLVSGRNSYFAEGDAYRGNSPHIIGTSPSYDETSGGDINVRWRRNLNNGSGFYVQGYFDRTLRTNASLGETRNTFDIDFIQDFKIFAGQRITYGGGLRWSPYKIIAPFPEETLSPSSATDHVHTAFLQDEIQLGEKFSFTAGAKLQHNNFSGFDVQPSARLLWSPGKHQSIWLGFTRAVTTPSDLEEDFFLQGPAGPNTFIQVVGNKHFKSEDVLGYEAGYRLLHGERFYLDLSGFWSQYSNLQSFTAPIITASGGNTYITIQYQNQISGSTSGFEFSPQVSIAPWWHINSSYSFVSSNFSANGPTSNISATGSVSTYEKSTPKHLVSVQSKIDLPLRFKFDQMYRYASDLAAQKVKAYQTGDLVLSRTLGHNLSFEVVGQNLLQRRHYEWGTGDPTQPPVGIYRAAYAQLTFKSGAQSAH
jgi:iron complex outermembrane receptor protein